MADNREIHGKEKVSNSVCEDAAVWVSQFDHCDGRIEIWGPEVGVVLSRGDINAHAHD
jgi:hypothetical protein